MFNSVGIKYEVMQCKLTDDGRHNRFEFRQVAEGYSGLYNPPFLYKMTREQMLVHIAKHNQSYVITPDNGVMLTGSLNPELVYHYYFSNNLLNTVRLHQDAINRREFHRGDKSRINTLPNNIYPRHGIAQANSQKHNITNSGYIAPVNNNRCSHAQGRGSSSAQCSGDKGSSEDDEDERQSKKGVAKISSIRSPLDQFLVRD